jgi:hypothetical protein
MYCILLTVSLGPITFHHEEDQLDLVSLPQEPLLLLELEATLGVVEMLLAKDIRVMINLQFPILPNKSLVSNHAVISVCYSIQSRSRFHVNFVRM